MVQLKVAESSNKAFVQSQPLVAVFVGATSGIGEYTLGALARTHADSGKGLRVYLVGRNQDAADRIISENQAVCPSGQFRFVKAADLRLLSDVDKCCRQIMNMEKEQPLHNGGPKIDILCMSQGLVRFAEGEVTAEGLEVSMSLLYYSRMRFTTNLLPLLLASPSPAHIISVYAAGLEKMGNLYQDDLSLTKDLKGHYSFLTCRKHVCIMTTLFFERLAQQHPGKLSLVHTFPGLVITKGYDNNSYPIWFKVTWALVGPFARRFAAIPAEQSGQRILFLATPRYPARDSSSSAVQDVKVATSTDGFVGGGAYSCNYDGETIDVQKTYEPLQKIGFSDKVWEHTMHVFSKIEGGKPFKG